ncbi:DUF2497 domain-containing protein [uncultured Sphingomonas sp.]|uniref:DUF2497 domain-containing protein n=1 Tax=uncultured Sphingomonas sp. TaxID=158754 RepID=UPI0035CBF582
MGDLSSEPSMEEILSSIKRIIAEEGEAVPGRGRRAGRAAPPPAVEDEVLELSDPMPQERPVDAIRAEPMRSVERTQDPAPVATPAVEKRAAQTPEPSATPTPHRQPEPAIDATPIVSSVTVEATRGALDQLSRMLIKPEPGADGTLEGLVRDMLRPMLRDWLDANLPALVEDLVAREIQKIISSRR